MGHFTFEKLDGLLEVGIAHVTALQASDQSLRLELEAEYEGAVYELTVTCGNAVRWVISEDLIGRAELHDNHPACRVLAGDGTQIFLSSRVGNPEQVAWFLREQFERSAEGYVEFGECFNHRVLIDVLSQGYGLVATGPDFLMEPVSALLTNTGARHSRLPTRWFPRGIDPDLGMTSHEELTVLVLGESYVVAKSFKTSGELPDVTVW